MTPEYEAWNRALAARFLQERPGQPLYLYTDESVLEEVAGEVGVDAAKALPSFLDAIRGTLIGGEPFRRWALETSRAVPEGSPPRQLAVLCFLVLVAVERETTHFQYYPELNRHLQRPGSGAPPGFDRDVPLLFVRFNDWLKTSGIRHGAPTATPPVHFPNVGWPLSQAIVRPTDRALLTRLFFSARLRPRERRSGSWLRSQILPRLITSAECGSRTRLLHLNERHRDTLDDVLEREYAAWNGEAVARVGPQNLHLRLCFDQSYGEWWFLAPQVPGTEGNDWRVGDATGVVRPFKGLEATPSNLWSLVGAGSVGAIANGPALVSRGARFRWLSIDTRAGAWAEVATRDVTSDQLVLVGHRDAHELAWRTGVEPREDAPPGHVFFFVPSGVDVAEGVDPGARVPSESTPMLVGGLALDRRTGTYLLCPFGLPDIVNVRERVVVDGMEVPLVDGVASLRRLKLAEGAHVVLADGKRLSLRLVRGLQVGPVPSAERTWHDELPIVPRLRLPHSEGKVWFVGAQGEAAEKLPTRATWASELGLLVTEVDVTGLVGSTWFSPTFAISTSYAGKPWVEPVPGELAEAQPGERALPSAASLRVLIAQLLVDYQPTSRKSDARWKRAFAGLMRTAHR